MGNDHVAAMAAPDVEAFVGTAEAAALLGKPESFLYDNAARLGIPRVRLGRQYRYRLSQVAAWAEAQEATSPHVAGE